MNLTKEIRNQQKQEVKEDKRNRHITYVLAGRRCPEIEQVITLLKGEHK